MAKGKTRVIKDMKQVPSKGWLSEVESFSIKEMSNRRYDRCLYNQSGMKLKMNKY